MENVPYGISDVSVSDKVCKTVKFGDGLTRIYSASWAGQFGVEIIRDESVEAFKKSKPEDDDWINPREIASESVFIVFDNEKSLDAMINQLQYVKESLKSV